MGGEADLYPPGGIDTKLPQLVQLFNECYRVHYHPGTEQAGAARMQDAGGQLVQDKGLVFYFDGVPGIGATLVARSEVHLIAERVDDLALALIAPLPANHCCYRHSYDLCRYGLYGREQGPGKDAIYFPDRSWARLSRAAINGLAT